MGEFSITHLLILSLILLLFFGPSKLPALGQSIGKAIKGFKQGMNEIDTDAKDVSHTQLNQNQNGMNSTQDQTVNSKPTDKKS